MKVYAIILDVDEMLDLGDSNTDPNLIEVLGSIGAKWTGKSMPGTITFEGRKLIMARLELTSDDPVSVVNSMVLSLGLDWVVLAMQEFHDNTVELMPADETRIFQFLPDDYDDQGNLLPKHMNQCNKYAGQADWGVVI